MNEFSELTEMTPCTKEIEEDLENGIPHQWQGLIFHPGKNGDWEFEVVVVGSRSKEDAGSRANLVIQDRLIRKSWEKGIKNNKRSFRDPLSR